MVDRFGIRISGIWYGDLILSDYFILVYFSYGYESSLIKRFQLTKLASHSGSITALLWLVVLLLFQHTGSITYRCTIVARSNSVTAHGVNYLVARSASALICSIINKNQPTLVS